MIKKVSDLTKIKQEIKQRTQEYNVVQSLEESTFTEAIDEVDSSH